jgi:hypothetical protein
MIMWGDYESEKGRISRMRVACGVVSGALSGYWDGLGGHCQLGEAVCGWDGVVKLFWCRA